MLSIPSGQLITGGGYGGLACLWHRYYANSVTVKHPSTRLQAIKLRISNTNYVIIHVYLPCDTQQTTVTSAFQEALDDVETLISSLHDITAPPRHGLNSAWMANNLVLQKTF